MSRIPKLIAVFERARELANLPGNDFSWSSWEDVNGAQLEIDAILAKLRKGEIPGNAQTLFLPTGPLQELGLSSGWGQEFLDLADQFEEAMAAPNAACDCLLTSPRNLMVENELGMDEHYAEVSLLRCADCGHKWLRYFHENEAFTGSGRWYLGAISQEQAEDLALHNAKQILEGLNWYLYGGSYFAGQTGRTSGPIHL